VGSKGTVVQSFQDIIDAKPEVIVAEATPAIDAAKKATSTIPIVMSPATT
jgi:putative ABC transport system substrate-binding protein